MTTGCVRGAWRATAWLTAMVACAPMAAAQDEGDGPAATAPQPGDDEAREPAGDGPEGEQDPGRAPEEGEPPVDPPGEGERAPGDEAPEDSPASASGEPEPPDPGGDSETAESEEEGIEGRIVDARTGQGLELAPVLARDGGQTFTAITEAGGHYRLVAPPGRYVVRSYYDLYHAARIDRIRVARGRFTELTLHLDPILDEEIAAEELEVVYRADTTTAAAQDQLRQASSGIGEGMGAAQMSQQGASDAGSAASRVVGVTIESSQLVVRGLGGRYTRVLLNGVAIPSTDPDRPGVDLDLLPTSVIDSLTLAKAFLPDMPADFAGGLMMIHTVAFPRELTFEAGLSLGIDTVSTGRQRLTYDGGRLDWLGFDDGTRALPGGIPSERVQLSRTGRYTSFEDMEAAAELFENTWQWERTTALPNMGLDLTFGDSHDLGGGSRFGYLATFDYGIDSVRQTGISRPRPTLAEDGSLQVFNDYRVERGTDEVQLGALATASLDLGQDHSFTTLTLFNRSMEDETQRQTGVNGELAAGERIERWQLQHVARTLLFSQVLGDHRNLGDTRLRLQWSGFASLGRRDEPDRRSVTYGSQGGQLRWLEKANSGERFYSELDQVDLGGTTSLRFPLWTDAWGTVGGRARTSGRDFVNRRFRFLQDPRAMDQTVYQAPVEELFDEEAIGTITRIREFTRDDDSYRSRQNLYAAFAMLETPIFGPLSFSGGVRAEIFDQSIRSRSPFASENTGGPAGEDDAARTDRTDVDVLPGAALKLELTEEMFVRAGYGMTVGRPLIRELAPYQYYDFLRDRNVQGNPDLRRTVIHNADLRWEWFFGEGEILAVSTFYKHFIDPIELQILNPDNYDAQFINADSARNFGAELELRLGLERLHESLSTLSFGGNAAFIASRVELPAELSGAVSSERRLFGTSPYVVNLSLRFDEPETDVGLALVYNVIGPRITDVGTRVGDTLLPDIEEQPFHSLDLVATWQANEHLKLKLKIQNLLFQSRDFRQGDFLTQRTEPGTSFGFGLTYSR